MSGDVGAAPWWLRWRLHQRKASLGKIRVSPPAHWPIFLLDMSFFWVTKSRMAKVDVQRAEMSEVFVKKCFHMIGWCHTDERGCFHIFRWFITLDGAYKSMTGWLCHRAPRSWGRVRPLLYWWRDGVLVQGSVWYSLVGDPFSGLWTPEWQMWTSKNHKCWRCAWRRILHMIGCCHTGGRGCFHILRHCIPLFRSLISMPKWLLGGRHKEGRSRGTGHDPTSLKNQKGEGRIAADVVLNIGI